jgi:hypothetical protein
VNHETCRGASGFFNSLLEKFQEDGPGWQDRINAASRKASGLA